jgi:hypothetical protein
LRARRLSIERERLQRYAIRSLQGMYRFATPPGLRLGLCDKQERKGTRN